MESRTRQKEEGPLFLRAGGKVENMNIGGDRFVDLLQGM